MYQSYNPDEPVSVKELAKRMNCARSYIYAMRGFRREEGYAFFMPGGKASVNEARKWLKDYYLRERKPFAKHEAWKNSSK